MVVPCYFWNTFIFWYMGSPSSHINVARSPFFRLSDSLIPARLPAACQFHHFPTVMGNVALLTKENNPQTTKINVLFTLLSQMNGFSNRNYTRKIAFRTRPHSARKMSCHCLFVRPMHRLLENGVYYREVWWAFDRCYYKNTVRKMLLGQHKAITCQGDCCRWDDIPLLAAVLWLNFEAVLSLLPTVKYKWDC